jgi:Streptomycin 6-kinase
MSYCFKPDETDKIINNFGKEFYNKLIRNIAIYADKWDLSGLRFVPSYSVNCIFICHSKSFGNAILKIGNPCRETLTEFNTLCEYSGRRFCKVFDSDIDNGVIIEERIEPGSTLRDEKSLHVRLDVFCSLYNGLHIESDKAEIYPTYTGWVSRITEYMSRRQDCKELYLYMKKAEDICLAVSSKYSKKILLHGDFHHDNILLGNEGKYIIIDPKGVIGDPIFDVPRFILNEFEEDKNVEFYKKINTILNVFEQRLNIPDEVLRQCLYIETVMAECWNVESGSPSEEYPRLLNNVAFVETILNH